MNLRITNYGLIEFHNDKANKNDYNKNMRKELIEIKEDTLLKWTETFVGKLFVYIYTPMCGTCKVAEQMLRIASEVGDSHVVHKLDANFSPRIISKYEISSVPCLLVIQGGRRFEKQYAFKSVQDVFERIKKG